MVRKRNVIVTCVYRMPGSKIEAFNDKLENVLCQLNEKKMFIMCGDLNIDLLSSPRHNAISDYLDILYSRGLYPLINKPSRITATCATLIDHICINVVENQIKSGLLINDISDHLPVFVTYDCQMYNEKKEIADKYVRKITEEAN